MVDAGPRVQQNGTLPPLTFPRHARRRGPVVLIVEDHADLAANIADYVEDRG